MNFQNIGRSTGSVLPGAVCGLRFTKPDGGRGHGKLNI